MTCGLGAIVVIIYNGMACMKAGNGEWYEYPIAGKRARKQEEIKSP
jgi:hypothetical protein